MTKKHYKSDGLRIVKPLAIDIFARPWQINKNIRECPRQLEKVTLARSAPSQLQGNVSYMRKTWPNLVELTRHIVELSYFAGAHMGIHLVAGCNTFQFGVFEISEIRDVQSLFRFSQCPLRWRLFSLTKCFIQGQIWTASRWKARDIDKKLQQDGVHRLLR